MDNNWKEIIRKDLFERQDTGYGDFQSKLMPTVPKGKNYRDKDTCFKEVCKGFVKK